jgi:glycosyltransferase involved in cell wall biosynthesis
MLVAPFGIGAKKYTFSGAAPEQWNGYHIGAMDWLPNEEAIRWFTQDIWPDLHKTIPEFGFYFAGRNMPEWCMQLQENGLHCIGEVPDADAFIADKKILIVPLRSGGGIRVKILEAMAAGKLVISTGTGMQGIEATDGVHYRKADTKAAFIQGIVWAMAHKTEAMHMAAQGRALVLQQYSKDAITGQVIARLGALS